MGIRFACHVCAKQLNIKEELAGKRGICPACSSKFRIPRQDAQRSLPIEEPPQRSEPQKPASNAVAAAEPNTAEQPTAEQPTAAKPTAAKPSGAVKPEIEIDLLSSDPDATWYVRPPSGGQYGPADGDVLRTWISEGRVASTALLWRDGWPNWRAANEVLPGLSGNSTARQGLNATAPPPPQASEQAATEPEFANLGTNLGTNPSSNQAASPTVAGQSNVSPTLAGRADVGTTRRKRSGKRIFWIGALTAIALTLIAVLAYLVMRNS